MSTDPSRTEDTKPSSVRIALKYIIPYMIILVLFLGHVDLRLRLRAANQHASDLDILLQNVQGEMIEAQPAVDRVAALDEEHTEVRDNFHAFRFATRKKLDEVDRRNAAIKREASMEPRVVDLEDHMGYIMAKCMDLEAKTDGIIKATYDIKRTLIPVLETLTEFRGVIQENMDYLVHLEKNLNALIEEYRKTHIDHDLPIPKIEDIGT